MRLLRPDGQDEDPRGRLPARPRPPAPARPRWRAALPIAAMILGAPVVAFGAAWTLPRGTGQVILQTAYTQGWQYLRTGGTSQRLPEYRKVETTALVEYGLTDALTLVATPSFVAARTGGAQRDDYAGPGYTDLGARVRLWSDDASVVSFQALGRLAGPQDDRRPAQTGNTDEALDLRLLAGRGFALNGRNAWLNAEAAYRLRDNDAPNEWRVDVTLGWRVTEETALLAQSFNVISDGEGRGVYPSYWYSKAQLSLLWQFAPKWSVQAGAFMTVAGENALREHGALLALWHQF
jgi:hypothetical protein